MLKKLLSFGIILGFAFSILLPNSFVYAEAENDGDATTEEASEAEEVANKEDTDETEEATDDAADTTEESDQAVIASDGEEDWSIYFYVISFVLVLTVGMYAFTEGIKKSSK